MKNMLVERCGQATEIVALYCALGSLMLMPEAKLETVTPNARFRWDDEMECEVTAHNSS